MAYIDVDKFAEKICNFQAIDEDSANAVIYLLRSQPTADVEEVKHGEWKPVPMFDEPDYDYISFECSCCGNLEVCEENYCSECGADMRERSDT